MAYWPPVFLPMAEMGELYGFESLCDYFTHHLGVPAAGHTLLGYSPRNGKMKNPKHTVCLCNEERNEHCPETTSLVLGQLPTPMLWAETSLSAIQPTDWNADKYFITTSSATCNFVQIVLPTKVLLKFMHFPTSLRIKDTRKHKNTPTPTQQMATHSQTTQGTPAH